MEPRRSGFSSLRPFPRWSWNWCSPSDLLANCFFVGSYWASNPAGDFLVTYSSQLQLDWPGIVTECAYTGIVVVAASLQKQDQFWISHQKIRVRFF